MNCATCGDEMEPSDPVAETFNPSSDDGTDVVCRDCAKRGGIDVGAFCRPLREVLDAR